MHSRHSRRSFLLKSIGGLCALPAFSIAGAPGKAGARPNVLILVLDTARRDRLSCYGYRRDTTPYLSSLVSQSTFYQNAYSVDCWTLPAHASLFTGLYPGTHGAHHEHLSLDASIPTLAEALQRAGYRTLGISENPFVGPHTGLTKGFEKFILRASDEEPPVPEHVAAFLDADKTKPFFCFINLLSCHQPYTNAGDCLGMYLSDPAYRDRCGYDFFTELAKEKLDETWLTHLGEHYDATVRHADQLTQAIVGVVEKRNLLDSTMLVVTSDHGENLGEHGLLEHQMCLYQTVVSIPLLVRFPEGREAGKTVKRPVQLVDIAPTVAEITQVPLRISNCQGASLLSPENGENRVVFLENYRHAAFGRCKDLQGIKLPPPEILNNPRVVACNRRLKSVVRTDLGLKLVVGTDGSRLGYDLTKDPEEKHSVADDPNFRRQFEDLEKAMQAATSRFVTRPDNDDDKAPVSKDTVELLKSIGYL